MKDCPAFFGLARYARKKRDSHRREPKLPTTPTVNMRAGGSPIFAPSASTINDSRQPLSPKAHRRQFRYLTDIYNSTIR